VAGLQKCAHLFRFEAHISLVNAIPLQGSLDRRKNPALGPVAESRVVAFHSRGCRWEHPKRREAAAATRARGRGRGSSAGAAMGNRAISRGQPPCQAAGSASSRPAICIDTRRTPVDRARAGSMSQCTRINACNHWRAEWSFLATDGARMGTDWSGPVKEVRPL
jgi:hypothetical protein